MDEIDLRKNASTITEATGAWDAEKGRLFGIAYRILGDAGHAEDVVSEVGIAAVVHERKTAEVVASWPAWLTTVCVRRSIDRSRHLASIKEDYPGPWLPEPIATEQLPDDAVANRDLLSLTLLHLAEQLNPETRAAFVLTRAFDMSAEEVARILGKKPAAVRQMTSRAARRLDLDRQVTRAADRIMLDRLIAAIHSGDLASALDLLLAEDAVFWGDGGGNIASALNPIFGAARIIRFFSSVITPGDPSGQDFRGVVEINGGLAIAVVRGERDHVLEVQVDTAGRVIGLRLVSNPDKLSRI